jgi:hypothetical protein
MLPRNLNALRNNRECLVAKTVQSAHDLANPPNCNVAQTEHSSLLDFRMLNPCDDIESHHQ